MNTSLVSIIIPNLNQSEGLKQTLKSILHQSWPHWEVIIQDALSTDGSDRLPELSHDRIYFHTEQDKGIYDAYNKGMAKANGSYYLFLGTKDQLASPTVLAEMLAVASEGADIIHGDVIYVNRVSDKIPAFHRSSFGPSLRWRNTIHHQGTLYAKGCFAKWSYDISLRILADYDSNLRLWKQGAKDIKWKGEVANVDASGVSKQFDKALYAEERLIKKRYLKPVIYRLAAGLSWVKFWWKR